MPRGFLRPNVVRFSFWIAAIVLLGAGQFALAQEDSINPGINRPFQNPNVEEWLARFEREDRDVYTRRDEIVAALDLKPGMDVADIGAGTGFFSVLFAEAVGPEGTVYALDIAENFVEHISSTAQELDLENIQAMANPVDSTNLDTDSVDLVFMAHTYHHFEYPFKMLDSIHDALRADGVVVLVDLERVEGVSPKFVLNMVRAGKGTFTDEFRNAGFELIEEVPFTDGDYILKFQLREASIPD